LRRRSRSSREAPAIGAKARTLARLIRSGAQRFRAHRLAFGHGMRNARDEATCLALHALNLRPDRLASRMEVPLTAAQVGRVTTLFARRIRERKPAAYLTGEAWLGGFAFQVDERAVVPRSYIAELLHEDLAPWISRRSRVRTALDLCTGSGCLAVLLAHSFPRARIDAADISPAALALARSNVSRHRAGNRVRLIHSDLFSALGGRRYDLIVSNPPYVRAAVMRRLPREYRWEPALALAGGRDGLDLVRRIVDTARCHLNPGGLLVVEAGRSRKRMERAYPETAFIWPRTSAGMDYIFLLGRDQLPEG
jgi:ribosomal protein L3 glutamine methyltransferase